MQPTQGSISIVNSRSPVKESYLNRSASIDDPENNQDMQDARDATDGDGEELAAQNMSPPPRREGIPIRR